MQESLRGELERRASRSSIRPWLEGVREHEAAPGTRVTPSHVLGARTGTAGDDVHRVIRTGGGPGRLQTRGRVGGIPDGPRRPRRPGDGNRGGQQHPAAAGAGRSGLARRGRGRPRRPLRLDIAPFPPPPLAGGCARCGTTSPATTPGTSLRLRPSASPWPLWTVGSATRPAPLSVRRRGRRQGSAGRLSSPRRRIVLRSGPTFSRSDSGLVRASRSASTGMPPG